jgi:hypothetical protein
MAFFNRLFILEVVRSHDAIVKNKDLIHPALAYFVVNVFVFLLHTFLSHGTYDNSCLFAGSGGA